MGLQRVYLCQLLPNVRYRRTLLWPLHWILGVLGNCEETHASDLGAHELRGSESQCSLLLRRSFVPAWLRICKPPCLVRKRIVSAPPMFLKTRAPADHSGLTHKGAYLVPLTPAPSALVITFAQFFDLISYMSKFKESKFSLYVPINQFFPYHRTDLHPSSRGCSNYEQFWACWVLIALLIKQIPPYSFEWSSGRIGSRGEGIINPFRFSGMYARRWFIRTDHFWIQNFVRETLLYDVQNQ